MVRFIVGVLLVHVNRHYSPCILQAICSILLADLRQGGLLVDHMLDTWTDSYHMILNDFLNICPSNYLVGKINNCPKKIYPENTAS